MRLLLLDRPVKYAYEVMKDEFSIVKVKPDIIYTQLTPVNASVPVFCPCTGIEHIVSPKVYNLWDKEWLEWNVFATAEHTFALILAEAKNLVSHLTEQRCDLSEGKYECKRRTSTPLSMELHGKRILIVGNGRVGRQVGRMARAFGMHVDTVDKDSTPELTIHKLNKADVVTVHIPLDATTEGLIDNSWFMQMKKDSIFVNTSRAGVVNENHLSHWSKRIRVALDTTEGYSEATIGALSDNGALLTPHVGGYADSSRNATDMWILEKMLDYKARVEK